MKTLLVYGIESVAGANIANTLCEHYHIVGVATEQCPEIEHCQILSGEAALDPPGQLLNDLKPDYVVDTTCCGDSAWNPEVEFAPEDQCQLAVERAAACKQLGITYSLLSSDAIFTGPWMFHEEDSEFSCSSTLGKQLIKLEADVKKACPESFIVRTHLFGWNWLDEQAGWIESLLERMQCEPTTCDELSLPGYATPILASELALILARGFEENISGTYHISGAERVNRQEFARRLAAHFNINWLCNLSRSNHFSQSERNQFGCGETSLQTRSIRRSLCVAMPTLTESIASLLNQQPARQLQDQFSFTETEFARAA